MTGAELAKKAKDIAKNYKTSYIWGGFGAPITEASLQRAIKQYSKNNNYASAARRFLGMKNAFYFDCVGLIKAILWGWTGDATKTYGGAKYTANGVPDISADTMIGKCSGVSADFSNIKVGEALWCQGHIGIYIGDGLAVESTPSWQNGVQITAVKNIGTKAGYNARSWTKHGKLPYCTYAEEAPKEAPKPAKPAAPATPAIKVDPAQSFGRVYAKTYTVTASALNMRRGAGTTKQILKSLKKGEKFTCYGYYTNIKGTIWLLGVDKDGNAGHCSRTYLK